MPKVLIVDDSEYTGNAIRILLESAGIESVFENESINTLNHLRENNIDLLILDIMMPRVSGLELYEAISSDEETKNIPILILTGRVEMIDYDKKFKQKMRSKDVVMKKPYDNKELLSTVKQLVGAEK